MWCPDDIGRDSWDWVGPPAWERACFNSPEWGGGSPDCIIVKYFSSKTIIIVRLADFSDFFSSIFVGKMSIFVSRPMKIVTFFGKNYSPKWVVDFPMERDTFRNKIMEIVEEFDETSYNNTGKPWKSSKILRVNPMFFIFLSFFILFLHFLIFF